MAKDDLQKMEALQQKIVQLQMEQQKVEEGLVDELGKMLKMKNAFSIDFDTLVGGLINAIDTIKSNPTIKEEWQVAGRTFRKSTRGKLTKISRTEPELA